MERDGYLFVPGFFGAEQAALLRLYVTYSLAQHDDHRTRHFAEKRAALPPDGERDGNATYQCKV